MIGTEAFLAALQIAKEVCGVSDDLDQYFLRKIEGERDHIHLAAQLFMLEMLFGEHEDNLLAEDHLFYQLAELGAVALLEHLDFSQAKEHETKALAQ